MQVLCHTRRGGFSYCRQHCYLLRRRFTSSAYSAPAQYAAGVLSERSSTIASVEEEGDALSLTWEDGHRSRFHFMWLRDHCPSIFDADTKQRSTSHLHIPRSIAPAQVDVVHGCDPSNALSIKWADAEGTTSIFQAQWLRRACYSDKRRSERLLCNDASRTPWEGASFQPPSVSFVEAMGECSSGSVSGMWDAMRELWRYGLLLVHDVPETYAKAKPSGVPYQDATEAFAKRIGFVRRTL